MNLILWRHAEAADARAGEDDLARELTAAGRRQAERMAAWLDDVLPTSTRILASPARRTQQTVAALGRPFETVEAIAPGASADAVLRAAGWPDADGSVLVVGHQPTLGMTAARLLGVAGARGAGAGLAVRKAGVWWFRSRDRAEGNAVVLVAVRSPDEP